MKISKIKIMQLDGTFSDYIPIGADSDNIVMEDGTSLTEKVKEIEGDLSADLKNYYKKTETYDRNEINQMISSIVTIDIQIVQKLPATGKAATIYLVPKDAAQTDNGYDEYIYINNNWEKIGDTKVDLSNYYTKAQTDSQISTKILNEGVRVYFGTADPSATIGKNGDLYVKLDS